MRNRVSCVEARLAMLGLALLLLPLALGACNRDVPPTSSTGSAQAELSTTPTGTPMLVRGIAGIRPGRMSDSDVLAMYGPGLVAGYQDGPPDSRYYTDPSHAVTLRVRTHTDDVVVAVKLSEGIALPDGVDADDDAALVATPLSVPVVIDRGIALGMTAAEVVDRLGRPKFDETTGIVRTLTYEVVADDPVEAGYINYNATYGFARDQLRSAEIYAGE
jgi:hypothetical protein